MAPNFALKPYLETRRLIVEEALEAALPEEVGVDDNRHQSGDR